MDKRTCGGCSTCCFTHAVLSIKKPTNLWCKKCTPSGCSIYEKRPSECSGYSCEWLRGFGEKEDRPDQSGIVLDRISLNTASLALSSREVLVIHEGVHGATEKERSQHIIREELASGNFVGVVRFGGKESTIYLPPGVHIEDAVIKQLKEEGFMIFPHLQK